MAVPNIKNSTALVLRFEKGQNLDGTIKVVSQKYSKVNKAATDEQLLDLCNSCLRISERTNFNLVNWNLLL